MISEAKEKIPESITKLEQLKCNGRSSYCVSTDEAGMYKNAFEDAGGSEVFVHALDSTKKGYEPFLRRETAYYLGSTDDYEVVRASLGGIYKMVVLVELQKEGMVKGRFTHLWSIDGKLEGEARTAADSMVYYLLGEGAQDVFNLQNGNGLSLNRNMMNTYVRGNDEFKDVADHLKNLKMEYGEDTES